MQTDSLRRRARVTFCVRPIDNRANAENSLPVVAHLPEKIITHKTLDMQDVIYYNIAFFAAFSRSVPPANKTKHKTYTLAF